jgi:hypothetical protein
MQVVIARTVSYTPADYLVLAGPDLDSLEVKLRTLRRYDADAKYDELVAQADVPDEEELTQLRADSAVLQKAIAHGYLTDDQAAALQLLI